MEGEGDEEIGEIGCGGVTSFLRKGGVGRRIGDVGIGRRKTQKKILKSAQTHCRVLLVGAGKVRQRIPEGWEETKDEDGQQTRESEIGSPVLHLFKYRTRYDIKAGQNQTKKLVTKALVDLLH